jgi:IclR family transcriptional regulator, acetate operon repressor
VERNQDEGGGLRSVSRAISALELIADAGELGVTELGRRLGVHKATASRLAATLAERGLLERDQVTDRYRIGFGTVRLAGSVMSGLDLVRTARPLMEQLAERTRETVNLGVLSGDGIVYIDQIAGRHAIVSTNWVGRRTPLHATSNGKIWLAFMEAADRDRLLAGPLEPFTDRTLTDPDALRRHLETVRRQGYAQTVEELEEGLNAVAAPVRHADGHVAATLGVSGPAFRMRGVDLPRIARATVDAATAVSRQLGYVERSGTAG